MNPLLCNGKYFEILQFVTSTPTTLRNGDDDGALGLDHEYWTSSSDKLDRMKIRPLFPFNRHSIQAHHKQTGDWKLPLDEQIPTSIAQRHDCNREFVFTAICNLRFSFSTPFHLSAASFDPNKLFALLFIPPPFSIR